MDCVCSRGNKKIMCNWGASFIEDVSPVEFIHLVFTHSYLKRLLCQHVKHFWR